MSEYIFEIDGALFNEETGEAVMKPKFVGRLIRCKDCKYWESDYGYCHEQGVEGLKPDDYCSYAERQEECQ